MKKKPFITQQPTLVPPERQQVKPARPEIKSPAKRGRKKSFITLRSALFTRRLYLAVKNGHNRSLEAFGKAIGLPEYLLNTMTSAFTRSNPEADRAQNELQQQRDENFCRPENLTAIPMLEAKDILKHDLREKSPLTAGNAAAIVKFPVFGEKLHYFGFIMPDGCMLHDGICKGDKIIAASNLRPANGDMVVCRLPGVKTITVRRYSATGRPELFDLYEGGTVNPVLCTWGEKLIYGVVIGVERSYLPGRLPLPPEK